jgi:hypothetical protein
MKILDIPQSGKQRTFVSVQSLYGQYGRRYAVPRKSPSAAQTRTRATFGRVRALWRTLTEDQRAAWMTGNQDTSPTLPSVSTETAALWHYYSLRPVLYAMGLLGVVSIVLYRREDPRDS